MWMKSVKVNACEWSLGSGLLVQYRYDLKYKLYVYKATSIIRTHGYINFLTFGSMIKSIVSMQYVWSQTSLIICLSILLLHSI